MASLATITDRPGPPKRRLSFPGLILRLLGNPVSAFFEDFYDAPTVYFRWLGLETLFFMEPELIQAILRDDAKDFSKPLYNDVLGEAIGGGLLNAEGEAWRWQRRLAAPLFWPEDVLDFVAPASARLSGEDNAGDVACRRPVRAS